MSDEDKQRLKQVWITGDFFVNPRRMVVDLEAALRDTPLSELEHTIHRFFDEYPVEMLMLSREDFITVIRNAVASGSESAPEAAGA